MVLRRRALEHPANPVDFEQRKGRVHRFGGHAVRRNVAAAHRAEALRSPEPDVWKALYDAARAVSEELGDFAPYWVFPGSAKIERHVLPYPLSRDQAKLGRLKSDLVMYRLAFGQPWQKASSTYCDDMPQMGPAHPRCSTYDQPGRRTSGTE